MALVDDDGHLGDRPQKFGKRVASMRGGVASNEHGSASRGLSPGSAACGSCTARRRRGGRRGGLGERRRGGGSAPSGGLPEGAAGESARDRVGARQDRALWTERGRTTLVLCGRRCGTPGRVALPKGSEVLGLAARAGGCGDCPAGGRGRRQRPSPGSRRRAGRSGRSRCRTRSRARGRARGHHRAGGDRVRHGERAESRSRPRPRGDRDGVAGAADGVPSVVHAGGGLLVARSLDGELAGSVVRVP